MAASSLTGSVDKLQVVEYLRANAGIRGALADFRIDDQQCEVVFKGPGYAASALVDRATGRFDLTESRFGMAAIVNDLHKGRDTGPVWGAVIDLSAAVLVFVSLTGLIPAVLRPQVPRCGCDSARPRGLDELHGVRDWVP